MKILQTLEANFKRFFNQIIPCLKKISVALSKNVEVSQEKF